MFRHSSLTQRTRNQILQKPQNNQAKKNYTSPKQMHDPKLKSINVKCHPNNEECKTKIHNPQITNNIKNRKEKMEVLWFPSSFMMINHLVFWHFLLDQTCATLHPLGHIFIPPKV